MTDQNKAAVESAIDILAGFIAGDILVNVQDPSSEIVAHYVDSMGIEEMLYEKVCGILGIKLP